MGLRRKFKDGELSIHQLEDGIFYVIASRRIISVSAPSVTRNKRRAWRIARKLYGEIKGWRL